MMSWVQNERVYRTIMNGALWTAFLAALAATKWPELSWVAGGVTAVMVLIAATVYCITPREDKGEHNRPEDVKPAATEGAGVTAEELTRRSGGEISQTQQGLKREADLTSQWAHLLLLSASADEQSKWTRDWARRRSMLEHEIRQLRGAQWERFVVTHHAADFAKAHRIYATLGSGKSGARMLPTPSQKEEAKSVVFNVGSVTIEIREEETTTNIQITSRKSTVVTGDVGARPFRETGTKIRSTIH
jgi:hypothetical protein